MSPIRHYFQLRAAGLPASKSAQCAGLDVLAMLRGVLTFALLVTLVLYLISDRANAAANTPADARKVIAEQQAYIAALEQTLAKCLGDKEQAIKIGDEWFLCGATSIGKY